MSTKPLFDAYKKMLLIRIAEQEIANLYLRDKIMSFVHFYIGQEAVAVGVCDALAADDRAFGNHRSHGHYLAKGGDLKKMICELLGKENGLAHGKGGSMHMIDKSVNFMGSTPILGSVVPLATGSAFEQKYTKKDSITTVFYGDGASEEGLVYESYNLAALFKLPIIFIVENNLYSVNTKLKDRRSAAYDLAKITEGIGLSYMKADGNDYNDVFKKAKLLVAAAREQGAPAVLECMVYRHMAHSAPIFDESCREEDTAEKRLEEDSVAKVKSQLIKNGISTEVITSVELEIQEHVLESIQFALKSEFPSKEDLYTNVYAQ